MKTIIRVVVFYGITFIFTIILAIVQQVSGIDANKIILPQFCPGLAAIIMIVLFRKDNLKITIAAKQISFLKYLGALTIPIVVPIILFFVYSRYIHPLHLPTVNTVSFAIMLGGMLVGAFGEELGWRGYLQNLLDRRINSFFAFLIVGILWGLWHVGNYANGPTYMLFFVFATIGYSAVMAWLLQGTDYNVVLACLFHFAVNAGFYMLKDALTDLRLITINGLVWIGLAVVIVIFNRKGFLEPRKENTEQEYEYVL
jgi:membrane protease YdiL (CAAX protease family)